MHVLILNWKDIKNPDVGGAEIILYELAKRLIRHGHRVTWFCRTFPGSAPFEEIDGIRYVRRGNRFTVYWEAFLYYRSLREKPDKVMDCVNTICWQTPLYVPKKNRLCYVNQLAKEVLFYELPPVISHVSYLLESLEYQTYRHTQFLCYSDSVKKDLRDFGIHSENVSTFPIGIDHARYIPGKKSKDPLFVFVARLTPMKRPDLCIEAMRIVIRTYPKAKLALVGYGPMEGPLERMIHAYALEQSVFLVNKDALFFHVTPKDKKVTLMQQAWALVLPSVKEGWGLVVTEAGACQTPAIVTNVTGLRDSVLPDTTGIFLSANPSAHELARAMIHIIEDASYRKKLSVGARTYSLTFTWDTSYDKFYEAITV